MLVILCDGSSKGNPGPASIGVIAWDRANNPRIIYPNYRLSEDIGIRTNMEAEWLALIAAMNFACMGKIASQLNFMNANKKARQEQEVYIFCDSQTVVKQANGVWKVKHDNIKPLYESFLGLKAQLPRLYISWVPRQLVYLADKATQKGVNAK